MALLLLLLFFIGFFTTPNALSFHRYYRKQLADLFLRFSGNYDNMPLGKVFNAKIRGSERLHQSLPLVQYLPELDEPAERRGFSGTKTSDYFCSVHFFVVPNLWGMCLLTAISIIKE